ncbi:MAG: hypothetical protein GC154_00155 [bacterium]|nr:hypothetical protein [bacterium]
MRCIVLSLALIFAGYGPMTCAWGQSIPDEDEAFTLIRWPLEVWLDTGAAPETDQLENAWRDGRLASFLGRGVHVVETKPGALDEYYEMIRVQRPECIECELSRDALDGHDVLDEYIAVVEYQPGGILDGELIVRDGASEPPSPIAAASMKLESCGASQERWVNEKYSRDADWAMFDTPLEAMRHLIVGDASAAAAPAGSFAWFLDGMGRSDLLSRFQVIRTPSTGRGVGILLRGDLYKDPFIRTLITETWLRDGFSEKLNWASPIEPVSGP